MVVFLWVAGAILVAALMSFTTWAALVGGVAALSDSRYERCPRCGHHGLVQAGKLHEHGCPEHHMHRVTLRRHA